MTEFGPQVKPGGSYISYSDGAIEDTLNFRSYALPTTFKMGVSMKVFERDGVTCIASVDEIYPLDNQERLALGLETNFLNMLFLRFGYQTRRDDGGGFACGVGINAGKVKIDYAFFDRGYLPDDNRFEVGLVF